MITFLCGTAGSGKSAEIAAAILRDLQQGIPVLFLVPEQMSVSAERRIMDLALSASDPIPTDNLEILNFSRLANRVFREVGGISEQTIGAGGKTLIMYQALLQCAPFLTEYRSALVSPENAAELMLSAIEECTLFGVTPAMLQDGSAAVSHDNAILSGKLKDLSLIAQTYYSLLQNNYDDPLEELPRLCRALLEKDIFSNYHIYFDSFNGLTPQEYQVTECLFRQAKNVTFSVCRSPETCHLPAFSSIEEMYHKLCRSAGTYRTVQLTDTHRFHSPALKRICLSLWDNRAETETHDPSTDQAVRLFSCPNIYTEAEWIASDIVRKVRDEGCHYRDFAIVSAHAEKYAGVIDAYLRRYQIPFLFSVREDMTQLSLIRLILCVFTVKQYEWRCADVIDLLKTGLLPLSEEECDLLESYIYTWNIHGARWSDEDAWTMHPKGYISEFTEADTALLTRVNEIRFKLTGHLEVLFSSLHSGATVRSVCAALYLFLVQSGVQEKLLQIEQNRATLIWNSVMAAMDELVTICGSLPSDAEQFSRLFSMLVKQMDIGRIPATVDEVVIGSASLLRVDGARHVYLIGANDGEFPAQYEESSIFSDTDKIALETVGIVLSSGSDKRNEEGLFHFWRAACAASDSLTVCYVTTSLSGELRKPSLAVERIKVLFPDIVPIRYEALNMMSRIECPSAGFSLLTSLEGSEIGTALLSYFREQPDYLPRLLSLRIPICQTEEILSDDTLRKLYPGNLTLSQTKIEDYVYCAFGYRCKHVLHLAENERAEIKPNDTGSFVHHILYRFFRSLRTEDGIRADLSEEEIESITEQIILDYLTGIFGGRNAMQLQSSRLLALFRRLKRATLLVIRGMLEEFANSEFVPTFFEMPISDSSTGYAVKPLPIVLEDGSVVHVIGRIDRVDTYRRGEDVYVRVVDYKTGSKTFSVRDLSIGLNMQLLLYLFAIWNGVTPGVRAEMRVGKDGQILPAGILICQAKPASLSIDAPRPSQDDINQALIDSMKRSGMLLNDSEILHAMDHSADGRYLPFSIGKNGQIPASAIQSGTLQTIEGFGKQLRLISGQVAQIAAEIKGGNCRILPLKEKATKIDACRYCKMKPVCRNFRKYQLPKRNSDELKEGAEKNE